MGGRSRAASQILSANGFAHVFNLSGGIKAFQGITARGPETLGLELFSGAENAVDLLVVAFSLEDGLRDFYLSMESKMIQQEVQKLFAQLASIEIKHQQRLLKEYNRLTGKNFSIDEFRTQKVANILEGGLTTDEYIRAFGADINSATDVVELAMSIEGQALDLYMRAGERTTGDAEKKVLLDIAAEEHTHLRLLGKLLDRME
ncbi:MAG: sulfurtransferase [Proteobacteria bacterium]|nr:sulfurtransferase [Pseudomonadota bacterium]MBU1708741.1 sulfurtransferase [Pseudomonadota bacterium]